MQAVDKRILIKAANLYYNDGLKQSEIAARLGVDRTTVSKYLKRALVAGIVRITVETDFERHTSSPAALTLSRSSGVWHRQG